MEENDSKMLTIIIPHYNSAKGLKRLLSTIPECKDIQTIVIDDNSNKQTEELRETVNEYHEQIEFYVNDRNVQSAGACRNIGLEHAEGKWLLFADADDYFLDNFYDIVKQYLNTDYDIVFFAPTSIEDGTKKLGHRHQRNCKAINDYLQCQNRENLLELTGRSDWAPWSKLVRRELVQKNNIYFDETLYANDIMFSAKIGFYSNRIKATTQKIYCVTQNTTSLTMQKSIESFNIRKEEYFKVCHFLMEHYDKQDWEYLHIAGIGLVLTAWERHYGIKTILSLLLDIKKNHIPFVRRKTLTNWKYMCGQLRKRYNNRQ